MTYCDTCTEPVPETGCKYCCFSKAQALYWFCTFNHGGQWSDLYAIQCQLNYRPGACERTIDGSDMVAVETYRGLHRGTLKPADVAAEIALAYSVED